MKVETKEIDGVLFVDLFGPFPERYKDGKHLEDRFREELATRECFVFVLHDVVSGETAARGMALLLRWLAKAGCPVGNDGVPPFVHVVTDDDGIRKMQSGMDSPFRCYATEEEAIAGVKKSRGGCLGMIMPLLALILWVTIAA